MYVYRVYNNTSPLKCETVCVFVPLYTAFTTTRTGWSGKRRCDNQIRIERQRRLPKYNGCQEKAIQPLCEALTGIRLLAEY